MNRFCPHSFISTPHLCLPRALNLTWYRASRQPSASRGRARGRETGKGIVLYNEHIELK